MKNWPISVGSSFILITILTLGCSRSPEEACADTTTAFVMSQSFVKKHLKSPGTAEFPYTSSKDVNIEYQGNCRHKVWAYVDAQNSFGATIRNRYYVEVKNKIGTDTWELKDIEISK
ncbi:hypothetical protein [Acaryochloris sp. CCMEE 5410]|uniref:hypothetical protein n=1 Tax=Acaryochloris sp. CCMEE 5410 TaxID=310037 RepID=UPI0002484392|nr:hypothetical protein [Acaryochloris sp. CCMEE 5410]KAI9129282.1 hypothetical protein ON05_034620 [Acaryochloris sp. CCMEE 5410]